MKFENFYISWFNKELHDFQNKHGFRPTNCIIDHIIYDGIVDEFITKHNIIGLKEHKNFKNEELICMGVKIRRGSGSQEFYFYKE